MHICKSLLIQFIFTLKFPVHSHCLFGITKRMLANHVIPMCTFFPSYHTKFPIFADIACCCHHASLWNISKQNRHLITTLILEVFHASFPNLPETSSLLNTLSEQYAYSQKYAVLESLSPIYWHYICPKCMHYSTVYFYAPILQFLQIRNVLNIQIVVKNNLIIYHDWESHFFYWHFRHDGSIPFKTLH